MAYFCYLCLKRRSPENKIILHSFPKNEAVRQKWINACELSMDDDLRNTKICSNHFTQDDYNVGGKSVRLGAVPSIGIPGSSMNLDKMEQKSTNTYTQHFESAFQLEADSSESSMAIVKVEDDESSQDIPSENSNSTPKKRCFAEPRYISEITIEDVSTPERASRVIKLVQDSFKKRTRLIKCLRNENLYLQKRLHCLEKLTAHSREKNPFNTDVVEGQLLETELVEPPHSASLSNMKIEIEQLDTELIVPDCQKVVSIECASSDVKIKQEPLESQEFISENTNVASAKSGFFNTNYIQNAFEASTNYSDLLLKQEPLELNDKMVEHACNKDLAESCSFSTNA